MSMNTYGHAYGRAGSSTNEADVYGRDQARSSTQSLNDNGWVELNSNEHERVWVGGIIYSIY
jgi:hypothetical protein